MIYDRIKPPLGAKINWSHPLSKGLVSFFLLNERMGNKVNDYTLNNISGTILDVSHPATLTSGWHPSKFGKGLLFDGSNDRIQIPGGFNKTISGNDYHTICFWYKVFNNGSYPVMFSTGDSTYFIETGGSALYWNVNGGQRTYSGITTTSTDWYHIAAVKNGPGNIGNLYRNGILISSYSGSLNSMYAGSKDWLIGYFNGSYSFNGFIDLPMIYNRPLLQSEIIQLYNNPFVIFNL